MVGPEGNPHRRTDAMEQVFVRLKRDFPGAVFLMVCPEKSTLEWIRCHRFLDPLHHYFAASDFVITQSGYGKVAELSALGIPYIAIPLDYHFEQEFFMGRRINHYGTGELITLRDVTPDDIVSRIHELMKKTPQRVLVDNGEEVAEMILDTVSTA